MRECCPAITDDRNAATLNYELVYSFPNGFIMRIAGMTVLFIGLLLSFSMDEWEAVGLIPMGIGLILLTIGEKQASVLGLADVEPLKSLDATRTSFLSHHETSATDEAPESAEVLLLLETLSRNSSMKRQANEFPTD